MRVTTAIIKLGHFWEQQYEKLAYPILPLIAEDSTGRIQPSLDQTLSLPSDVIASEHYGPGNQTLLIWLCVLA